MELKINNKAFVARWEQTYDGIIHGKVLISFTSEEDRVFFFGWMKRCDHLHKKDYAIDIEYRDGDECGTLVGCFPVKVTMEFSGDKNDVVEVHYDFNKRT